MYNYMSLYNTALLVLDISKEDFEDFLTCKPFRMVFGVGCNRVFYKFPNSYVDPYSYIAT